MFQYVTIALLATVAVFVLVNVIKALIRGLKKSVGTLVAIVLSVIIATIITFTVCTPGSAAVNWLMETINGILPEGDIKDLFAIEELGDALAHYSVMLAAPFFFTAVFSVASIVVSIIVAIIVKIIPPHKKPAGVANRLGGALVGLVCGLLVSVIFLMPVVGTINMATSLEDTALTEQVDASADSSSDDDIVTDLIAEASESELIQILNSVGCGYVYDVFASSEFDGERVYLKDDVGTIVAMLGDVTLLGGDMSEYSQEQIDALDNIIVSLDTSPLLKNVVAGIFSTASEKWTAGETFIGVEKFSAGELLDPVVDEMLVIMTTSDKTNISADLGTMKDVFAILIKHDMLKGGDSQTMLDKLSQTGAIGELIVTVNKNERMAPLADEITLLSIRTLASSIGVPADKTENYNQLMNSVADLLNDSHGDENRAETIEPQIIDTLENYGVDIGGEAATNVSHSIVTDLGGLEIVTASDVEEFFTVYAVASAQADEEARGRGYSFDKLSSTLDFTVNADGTVSVGDRVLKNYTAENYLTSSAFVMGNTGADFGGAATLMSAETMVSSIITMEDIMSFIGSYADCEDIEAEAEKISEIISEAMSIFANTDFENTKPTDLIASMGGLLDKMKDTEVFGSGTVEGLMKAVLQSDSIGSALGLSKSELTNFADKITEVVNAENSTGYTEATQAVSGTIKAITSTTDTEKTKEDKLEATKELIDTITPESAEMVSSIVSSSMVTDMGVAEENAEAVSSAMSSMLNNMAAYKTNNPDSDNHEKEAEAVNTLLDMAMNITTESTDAPLFSSEENEGVLGTTADEFIDLIVNSEVVSQTVKETVKDNGYSDNPLGLPALSEEEKASVTSTLENYFVENGGDAELAATLESIAAIVNIDLSLLEGQE